MKSILRPLGGHILDIDPSELTPQVLSLARNVHMRKGFPSRIRGRRLGYTAAPIDPVHMLNFNLNTFNWWLLFGQSNIYAIETSNPYNVTPTGGLSSAADTYEWSSTLLNGIPVFTNGLDAPMYWTGVSSDEADVLPDWPANTTCKFIVSFRFHLFALDIDGPSGTFNNLIMWSEATDPGAIPQSWTPLASNEAGSAFCADTEGRCIAGSSLGTQLMIYKPSSIYAVEYAGQQPDNIFTVRPVNRSAGLIAPHALKTIGTSQVAVGNDDVIMTDGVNMRSIADNRIKRALANSIDEDNARNVFTVYDSDARELWVCIPETGNRFANIAHIWDERRDNWVTRDLVAAKYSTFGYINDDVQSQVWNDDSGTWDSDFSTWNEAQQGGKQRVFTADSNGIYVEDVPDATAVNAILQRLDLTFDDAEQIKVTNRVYIEGSGPGLSTLLFRLGARNSTDDGVVWGPYVERQAGGREYEVAGKYISIEVTNDSGEQEWTVNKLTIEAEYDGAF